MNLIKVLNNKNYLIKIIFLNIIVFIIINTITTLCYLFELYESINLQKTLSYNLGASSSINILITKPWTLVTHMFTHLDVFHISFNLCYLYFGGKIFLNYLSQKTLIYTYIMGGITGYVFYLISLHIFPVFENLNENTIVLGASASTLAILIASATYVPNLSMKIIWFNNIKLKHIAIILIGVDLLSIINGNPLVHIAHIGGASYGLIYIYLKKKGVKLDFLSKRISYIFDHQKSYKYKKDNDYEYNSRKNIEQQKIDKILDKISSSGYDSLSEDEKQKLFDQK